LLRERQNAPQKADKMVLKGKRAEKQNPEDKSLSDEEDKSPLTTETNRGDMKRLAAKYEEESPLTTNTNAITTKRNCR
jgi:hypothetical protein